MNNYTFYGSSPGVAFTDLVAEATSEAQRSTGHPTWALQSVDEYNSVVTDEHDKVLDIEAKVVLRAVG